MPNILLIRVDNRLVYGQVGVTWAKTLGANLAVVVDDTAAEDRVQQLLMSVTAKSSGVGTRFFMTEKTATIIGRAAPEQKIFIVCCVLKGIRRLAKTDVTLKEVNAGDMHFPKGKHAMTKKVHVDDEDMDDLKYLVPKGTSMYAQSVPGDLKSATE